MVYKSTLKYFSLIRNHLACFLYFHEKEMSKLSLSITNVSKVEEIVSECLNFCFEWKSENSE